MKTARQIPTVTVYSRHRSDCKYAGKDGKSGRNTVTSCSCPKQLFWSRDGKTHRESADTCDGVEAKEKAAKKVADWKRAAAGEPAPPPKASGVLLEDAITKFLQNKEADKKITRKHIGRLRVELGDFSRFAAQRGIVLIADVKTEDVLDFRNSLVGAQNTLAKKVFRLIGFFRFAVELDWIPTNPAQKQIIKFTYSRKQRPRALTDAQLDQFLAALPKLNGRTTGEVRAKLRSIILLQRHTGLAIKDALLIERDRFAANGRGFTKVSLHRAKTGKAVSCPVRDEIVEQIFAGANPTGRFLFIDSIPATEVKVERLVSTWGKRINKVGKLAELRDEHGAPLSPTTHWFRHSFVLWAFSHDLTTEDVAALLGDSPRVVAEHYSEWVSARQERLDERLIAALQR